MKDVTLSQVRALQSVAVGLSELLDAVFAKIGLLAAVAKGKVPRRRRCKVKHLGRPKGSKNKIRRRRRKGKHIGRPKGSKNKVKHLGRPKGSKNKPKAPDKAEAK